MEFDVEGELESLKKQYTDLSEKTESCLGGMDFEGARKWRKAQNKVTSRIAAIEELFCPEREPSLIDYLGGQLHDAFNDQMQLPIYEERTEEMEVAEQTVKLIFGATKRLMDEGRFGEPFSDEMQAVAQKINGRTTMDLPFPPQQSERYRNGYKLQQHFVRRARLERVKAIIAMAGLQETVSSTNNSTNK